MPTKGGKAKCGLEVDLTLLVTLALLHRTDIKVRAFIDEIIQLVSSQTESKIAKI